MDNGESSYRRYLEGDEEAFARIVKEYFDPLVSFLTGYVSEIAAAEDIAMDVFAWIIVHKHRYRFTVSLKTYLFMLGRSRALDYLRRQSRAKNVPLCQASQLADPGADPERRLWEQERSAALAQALEQLPRDMRLAVHLVYVQQLSAQEAGKVLKKSRKQIYNLLFRAKNTLRHILADQEAFLE